jgi:hypothetical protein
MRKTSISKIIFSQWNLVFIALLLFWGLLSPVSNRCEAKPKSSKKHISQNRTEWTEYFNLDSCSFSSVGSNEYFILKPKYRLVLAGKEGEDSIGLTITVLDETKNIGNVETRVVEEREKLNGKLSEISRNYYAFCTQTGSIFYFGEDVDAYRDEKIIGHEGSWRADSANARAGLLIPGTILLGAKYYTEIAPNFALDRAKIVSNSELLKTPAGTYDNCLKIKESSPLERDSTDYKYYAPGIGLIKDGNLLLTWKGFIKR